MPVNNGAGSDASGSNNGSASIKGIKDAEFKEIHENAQVIGAGDGSSKASGAGVKAAPEAGRNDPCPCGSGKKYKKCHGVGKRSLGSILTYQKRL